jgi:hypothetical protein
MCRGVKPGTAVDRRSSGPLSVFDQVEGVGRGDSRGPRPFHWLLGSECGLQAKGAPSALSRHIVGRPPGLAQQLDICVLEFGPLGENVPLTGLLGHVPDDRLHAPIPSQAATS